MPRFALRLAPPVWFLALLVTMALDASPARSAAPDPIRRTQGVALTPAWTGESDQLNAFYGYSVATAGDVDGDGYSDVIVGAINYQNGEYEEGRAFLYRGSATGVSPTPSWTAEGNQVIARFGQSVASAGDVNGDGFDDVIVGAPQYDSGSRDEGRAYIYLGSAAGLAASPSWIVNGNQDDAYLGQSVATAGDVNGDGYADVLVGAYGWDDGQANEGRVFLYLGSASGPDTLPDWSYTSDVANAYFGRSIATAGDVNGDGYDDVVIGAHLLTSGATSEGKAFLFLGGAAGLAPSPSWSVTGNQGGAQLGISVATAGDVNGDGYADMIVGAPGINNGQVSEGRVAVYLGSAAGPDTTADWSFESNDPGAQLGWSVAPAGDLNGDGFADVVVGAPLWGPTTSKGRAYAFLGSAAGLAPQPVWTVASDQDDGAFAQSVCAAGDVDGDGYGDLIVGAPLYDHGDSDEGSAFVYRGSAAPPDTTAGWIGKGALAYGYFGYSVASAGDVNGDGYGDIIVGAIYDDQDETDEGRAYLFLGSASGPGALPAWTAESDQANAHFGNSVASAGDVNGDGYGDVIVGAHQYDDGQSDEGKAYVYLGSPAGLSATPSWTAQCDQDFARFGVSVSSAGDVNGDGYGDVIVGAMYYHNPTFEEGRAFLYLGSASGLSPTPAWTAESDQSLAFFGNSVACAGDVNGDGYSDVIVGAYAYDNTEANEGRAFVYLGSPSGLSLTPAWTAESDQANAYFGITVAGAGDVNGDGYSDVIVGAHGWDGGATDEGKAYVYLGSSNGLAPTPAWTASSGQASSSFAYSVAGVGDVNGDGFADVAVGANTYDHGSSDEGAAFFYLGSPTGPSATPSWSVEGNQVFGSMGFAVAAGGDVNGDGFGDALVGAPYYNTGFNNGEIDRGWAFVYYGNGGDGLDRRPAQSQVAGGPIALLGRAATERFRLDALGRTAVGRGRVRLEWETRALGVAFSGAVARGPWLGTGAPSPGVGSATPMSAIASGLALDAPYRWRLRVASRSPFFPHSPWLGLAANGPNETDLRTGTASSGVGDRFDAGGLGLRVIGPNPSASACAIAYTLPAPGRVRVTIHDLQGRRVATLVRQDAQPRGLRTVTWSGRDDAGARVRAGVYWVRLDWRGRVIGARLVRL
jgi:hypothetical protein